MSTGLFADEEGGYNLDEVESIEETKFKLKVPNSEPSTDDSLDGLEDFGDESDENFGAGDFNGDEPSNDKPFDDEPFEAGVDADEESDPKTFIQQLAGKLGQSLRAYSDEQGQPDFDLEKFAVNSVLSATHTGQMDDNDQSDIIKKVKSSGNDGGDIDVNVDVDTDGEGGDVNVDTDNEESQDSDMDFGDVEEGNFNLGEGKTPHESLDNSEKKPIFVTKDKIMDKLNEVGEVEPSVKPKTKPKTKPTVKPTRRQKPFRPTIQPKVEPKANSTNDGVLHESEGSHGKIIDTKFLDDKTAIITVALNDAEIDLKFENTGDKVNGEELDGPLKFTYESVNSPDNNTYTVNVEFFGDEEAGFKLDGINDDYIEKTNNG